MFQINRAAFVCTKTQSKDLPSVRSPAFLLSTQPVVEGILAMKGAGGEKSTEGDTRPSSRVTMEGHQVKAQLQGYSDPANVKTSSECRSGVVGLHVAGK